VEGAPLHTYLRVAGPASNRCLSFAIAQKGAVMPLKVLPRHIDGEIQFHVVDTDPACGEQPAVIFTASSWAEAEQYIADLGGG
jgi:hypothetical protein